MNPIFIPARKPPLSLIVLMVFTAAIVPSAACFASEAEEAAESFFKMSLEELMETSVGVGTLTATPRRHIPAAITHITQDMIRSSGARNLYELFDIYVPNFQWIKHNYLGPHMGLRGIISDKDDKYLVLVNGRTMNERTEFGINSESDLPMLDDIHHIDVIRGPGSAIYGLGAVSMVIDIHTETAETFQGSKITTKAGAFEEFYTFEFKHGTMLDEDTGLYLYGGISEYPGASPDYSPMVHSGTFTTRWGDPVRKGKPASYNFNSDRQSYRDIPKLKLHAELTTENFDLWVRYTRGGEQSSFVQNRIAPTPYGWGNTPPAYEYTQRAVGYQQLTAYGKYRQQLSDTLSVDYVLSYDFFDAEKSYYPSHRYDPWRNNYREDEYLGRILARWTPNDRHSVAVGIENSWENFGMRSPGFPHTGPSCSTYSTMPRWSTSTTSLFTEHQYKVNDQWTAFWGARADRSTYSDNIYSPRAAAVYTPTDKDTWKFMYSKSSRPGYAARIRNEYRNDPSNSHTDPEVLEGYELRYERQHTKNLHLGASAFFNTIELISWSGTSQGERIVGEDKTWGLEFEATYTKDRVEVQFSHAYAKLYDFDLGGVGIEPLTTAEPHGYGKDLSNWSKHISKLYTRYKVSDKLSMDGSIVAYWGFDGLEDKVKYNESQSAYVLLDPGYDKTFGPNVYLNLGLEYKASKNLDIRLSGYNLLGLLDIDLNKRNYLNEATYRCHAPAIAVTCEYRF